MILYRYVYLCVCVCIIYTAVRSGEKSQTITIVGRFLSRVRRPSENGFSTHTRYPATRSGRWKSRILSTPAGRRRLRDHRIIYIMRLACRRMSFFERPRRLASIGLRARKTIKYIFIIVVVE